MLVLFLRVLSLASLLLLGFVVLFLVREGLPALGEVGVVPFLRGTVWMPVDYTGSQSFGIANFVASTALVSLLAVAMAAVVGMGAALCLALGVTERVRVAIMPLIELLAGVPSVVYGFVGLVTLVKALIGLGVSGGSCVLAASVVLAVMLLPYVIPSLCESVLAVSEGSRAASDALGVSVWHFATTVALPASWRGLLASLTLALGRAMGETMAVMMVIGNANVAPTLLGRGETIASLVALEMGTAVPGSTHYHALYAAGLVLLGLLLVVDALVWLLRRRWRRG